MSMVIAFLGTSIITISELYSWYIISDKKFKINSKSIFIKMLLFIILVFINHNFNINLIKGFITIFLEIFFCKYITNYSVKKSIVLSFVSQLIIIVSEAIVYAFITFFLGININSLTSYVYIGIILDLVISSFNILISRLKILRKFYLFIIKITNLIKIKQLIIFVLFVILGTNIFTTSVYFNNNMIVTIVLNIVISLIYTLIIILFFNYQDKYYKIDLKYKMSLNNLKSQEKLINEYRIMNHENKNHLLTIRTMSKSKKLIEYINSIVDSKNKLTNQLLVDVLKIPSGGIRGLVYNKVIEMKERKIKYYISVDNKITNKKISKLTNSDLVDICSILGVFLDNAIEEVINIENGIINISFHWLENKLLITISNNYRNNINIYDNKFFNRSSKGKNRGYGLQLVKRIIENNKKIYNKREITKDLFIQKIEISM